MKKVIIAFDVDGTLIENGATSGHDMRPNARIVTLLRILASFKNVQIMVWSGGGKDWAETAVEILGLNRLVDYTLDKNYLGKSADGRHMFKPEIVPDIAIDDIHDCDLGFINLIVREK